VAVRLAAAGVKVTLGSRDAERARGVAEELVSGWPDLGLEILGADNVDAAAAEVVVLATPWDSAISTLKPLKEALSGKVLISMANALTRLGREWSPLLPPRGSIAATLQAAVPSVLVAAAFHHLPAKEVANLDRDLDLDVMVCSDHGAATEATIELIRKVPGLRGIDCGGLGSALAIEALTPVLISINVNYKAQASIRVTGLDGRA
jgi:8-hydroxy-5-deazaflavin:NADPH oxidoreductase